MLFMEEFNLVMARSNALVLSMREKKNSSVFVLHDYSKINI